MLRARKPEVMDKRLKLFMYGPAGVGKTTAACQFPNSYIIDCERGTDNYEKLISGSGSVVFQTTNVYEMIQEVKALASEKHDFRTLVIDPITPVYNDLLEKCESKVGSDFGRHYGAANKDMKRLANLLMSLDLNVIVTAHAKAEYGQNLSKLGYTFDGWKSLDYWFDLVVELGKKGKKRYAKVVKTRIDTFPDEDVFEWSYDAIRQRYDATMLEKPVEAQAFATSEQVSELKALMSTVRLPEGTVEKWLTKAGVDDWDDMPADTIAKCIDYVKGRQPTTAPAPASVPKPGPAPVVAQMSTEDAAKAGAELDQAWEAAGFDFETGDQLTAKALKQQKFPNLVAAGRPFVDRMLQNIRDGKYDKFKRTAAAAS